MDSSCFTSAWHTRQDLACGISHICFASLFPFFITHHYCGCLGKPGSKPSIIIILPKHLWHLVDLDANLSNMLAGPLILVSSQSIIQSKDLLVNNWVDVIRNNSTVLCVSLALPLVKLAQSFTYHVLKLFPRANQQCSRSAPSS